MLITITLPHSLVVTIYRSTAGPDHKLLALIFFGPLKRELLASYASGDNPFLRHFSLITHQLLSVSITHHELIPSHQTIRKRPRSFKFVRIPNRVNDPDSLENSIVWPSHLVLPSFLSSSWFQNTFSLSHSLC